MDLRTSNNLDFLRFFAASLVLFSHSFALIDGKGVKEPLSLLTNGDATCGGVAVTIFL